GRPPTSPLLPYTTLFRSHAKVRKREGYVLLAHSEEAAHTDDEEHVVAVLRDHDVIHFADVLTVCIDDVAADDLIRAERRLIDRTDRKSTRLNSSHVKISY